MESPREAANRKCPYCRAETLPPRDSTLGGPPGARWRKGQSVPRSATPTSMTQPCPPQSSAARLFGVHCRPRPAPPRALLGTAQPVRPGPDENSTPGTSRCTSSRGRGGGVPAMTLDGLGALPSTVDSPRVEPEESSGPPPSLSEVPATLAAVSAVDTRSRAVITPLKKNS